MSLKISRELQTVWERACSRMPPPPIHSSLGTHTIATELRLKKLSLRSESPAQFHASPIR
jgi:hypothetical protein